MQTLNPLEPGPVFWPERDDLSVIRGLGVRCGQMVVHGTMDLAAAAAPWKASLEETGFQLITVFAAYEGEDYADIPTVQRTVGFIPQRRGATARYALYG